MLPHNFILFRLFWALWTLVIHELVVLNTFILRNCTFTQFKSLRVDYIYPVINWENPPGQGFVFSLKHREHHRCRWLDASCQSTIASATTCYSHTPVGCQTTWAAWSEEADLPAIYHTLWHGNTSRIFDPLRTESAGNQWTPLRDSQAGLLLTLNFLYPSMDK